MCARWLCGWSWVWRELLCERPENVCAAAQIKLSTKSFDAAAAGVAAEAIVNCASSLTHADLSDVIAGRPEAEALNSLRILSGALAQVPAMSTSL